jgi:hypothetical protein
MKRLALVALVIGGGLFAAAAWLTWKPRPPQPDAVVVPPPAEVRKEIEVPRVTFTDITPAAGITFTHRTGAAGGKLLPEAMGAGVVQAPRDRAVTARAATLSIRGRACFMARSHVVVQEAQHAVHSRDGFGVDFVGALGLDHVDHFFDHVDV